MRVLMLNANTFSDPPCIPIGLEYAAAALAYHGHGVRVLDLWRHAEPMEELIRVLRGETFDVACVSVRNLDTAQAARYLNFIPAVRALVRELQRAGLRVILGGSGFSAMPVEILEYTEADAGVRGPADIALPRLLELLDDTPLRRGTETTLRRGTETPPYSAPAASRVLDGFECGIMPELAPHRPLGVNYDPYLAKGGLAGFATQYGCPCSCLYCIEANTRHWRRNPDAVADEVKFLVDQGYADFHLCDSEFNIGHGHCLAVLDALERGAPPFRWALYMKPAPCGGELLDGLRRTGAHTITLSVDSAEASAPGGAYSWDNVASVARGCRERGIHLAVDLTVGLPDESLDSVRRAFDALRATPPDKVNVNAWLRVYGGTGLERLLRARPDLHAHLSEPLPPGPPLEGLFYSQIPQQTIDTLIGGDPLFKREGFDRGVNYELFR